VVLKYFKIQISSTKVLTKFQVQWRGTAGWLHTPQRESDTKETFEFSENFSLHSAKALKRFLKARMLGCGGSLADAAASHDPAHVQHLRGDTAHERAACLAVELEAKLATSAFAKSPAAGNTANLSGSAPAKPPAAGNPVYRLEHRGAARVADVWPWEPQDDEAWKKDDMHDKLLLARNAQAAGKRVDIETDHANVIISGGYEGWRMRTLAATVPPHQLKLFRFAFERWRKGSARVLPSSRPSLLRLSGVTMDGAY
jgi:hypothetical protein